MEESRKSKFAVISDWVCLGFPSAYSQRLFSQDSPYQRPLGFLGIRLLTYWCLGSCSGTFLMYVFGVECRVLSGNVTRSHNVWWFLNIIEILISGGCRLILGALLTEYFRQANCLWVRLSPKSRCIFCIYLREMVGSNSRHAIRILIRIR